ncbi:MAG: 3-oxoacyl-[acyl-carrier-protein] synthase III C-terminal domain-containing protein, partial [Pseudomonadota bacterium]
PPPRAANTSNWPRVMRPVSIPCSNARGIDANIRIIDACAKRLSLSAEKIIVTIDQHANTSSASIPLALEQGIETGRITRGQLLVFAALGGGLAWGSALVRY